MERFWSRIYQTVSATAASMNQIDTVLSVFNSNIDAVAKVSPQRFAQWLESFDIDSVEETGESTIVSVSDFLRGFLYCFERGIAQEWLIQDTATFEQIKKTVGYDRLQMGGQGGIIGNVMSAAGVKQVYVHAASLPSQQADLFLHNTNLLSADSDGTAKPAYSVVRDHDTPLIHWILEFDKGDSIELNGKTYTCPKSNRFIATYDPLNFKLAIDSSFVKAVDSCETPINYCLLSGFQMLTEPLADGSSAQERIDNSIAVVSSWKAKHPSMLIHFEFASTQDKKVRKMLLDSFAPFADSMGVNEQELIDLLEVIDEKELAQSCRSSSVESLIAGLIALYEECKTPRIQLHYFGQFVTIQKNGFIVTPEQNLRGMAFAATAAASKASTGSIDTVESLLAASTLSVNDTARELFYRAADFTAELFGSDSLKTSGVVSTDRFDLIVIPTLLVEKPVTLVGMGDTISSLSLTGAR